MTIYEVEQKLKGLGYNVSLTPNSVYYDGLSLKHSGNINENLVNEIISLIQQGKTKVRIDG